MIASATLDIASDIDVYYDLFRGGRRPIVCFANDWKTDPTSKHHIMRTYSGYTDVVWMESTGTRKPSLLKLTDQRRILHRLRSSASGMRTGGGRVRVVSPLIIPLPGNAAADSINAALYRSSIRRALGTIDTRELPLLWVYAPNVATYLQGIPRSGLVYHCVDRWWAFSEHNSRAMRSYHRQLCEQADIVFASSVTLLDDCLEHNSNSHLIPHGVDWQHFAPSQDVSERPADLTDASGPILGFFGLIHEWVDQDLLVRIANAFPQATIALIGSAKVDVSRLRAAPNIRLLGQKSFGELPAYCAAFDVGLIPFVFNDLTAAVNPIKLREYLSAGLPVVASALPDIEAVDNSSLVTARDADEFISAIRRVLADGTRGPATRQAAALEMKAESWAGRCRQMASLVAERLHG